MPIEASDTAFTHIQVVDDTHFNYIVYVRKDTPPHDFEAKLIYRCSFVNGNWVIDSIEEL